MRIVVALGGNALLRRGETLSAETQQRNMRRPAEALARLAKANELIVVHGNGPQVGLLALEAEAYRGAPPMPLDVLGAESQGMIGYIIQQALRRADPDLACATLLTQTVVAEDDPAFKTPSKPVGPVYTQSEAEALQQSRGWTLAEDGGGYRRVVASPEPLAIVELAIVRGLLELGAAPICAGGGGVPVAETEQGLRGLEAVVDKDLAAALIAIRLKADRLVILTDVDGVYEAWATPEQRLIGRIPAGGCDPGKFAAGSMGPKIKAACRFAAETGAEATIANLDAAREAFLGTAGTVIAA